MIRSIRAVLLAMVLVLGHDASADQIKGTLKTVGADKDTLTVTVGKKDQTFSVAADSKLVGDDGKTLKDRLAAKALQPGVPLIVTFDKVDGKELVREVRIGNIVPAEGYLDADKAGPDLAIQGEYEDGRGRGAQVVAQGDGLFQVLFLAGGLPGAGWDGKTIQKASARTLDGQTTVADGGWKGTIAAGKLTATGPDGASLSLARVARQSPTQGAKPPPGAFVLFDGTNADEWVGTKMSDDKLLLPGGKTKRSFHDFKLHLEFRLPYRDRGQGNSGVYMLERYEIQIINSFGQLPARNNGCGSIYTQTAESVNMTFPPLAWQTYDIDFKDAKYDAAGKKTQNAVVTLLHNGVKVHDQAEIKDKTGAGKPEGPAAAPIYLQLHGSPVYFRNVWVVAP